MLRRFSKSLAFRLGISVIVIETLFMTAIGLVYYNNFSTEINKRQEDRLRIASEIIVAGSLNLSSLVDREIMSSLVGDEIADAMLIDSNNQVLFSLVPEYRRVPATTVPFLGEIDFAPTTITFSDFEYDGLPYKSSKQVFSSSANQLMLYLRIQVSNAEAEKQNTALQLLTGFSLTVVMTSATIFWFFNTSILGRIANLVTVIRNVEKGDLSARSPHPNSKRQSDDEISVLEIGTNSMISRLESMVSGLEQRVAARTRDLTVSAEVSRQIASFLRPDELLNQLVERTATAFGFYEVGIFQYKTSDKTMNLVAASGNLGKERLRYGQTFKINSRGLVPSAARELKVMVSNNVEETNTYHLPNPLLPDTRSEVALPILFGGELFGVLDLQSEFTNRFSESDIKLFSAFADQIAVSFRNAALFNQAEVARQQAEQADKAKSAFLASTSHELRTPLNAIINLTSFVRRGMMGEVNSRQEEMLTLVMQSGQNLLALINDVLDMSKIESGALKLYIQPDVDVRPIIQNASAMVLTMLQNKPVNLDVDIPEELPPIPVDKHRFQQILLNLLSNACKFTEKGSIQVNVQCLEKHLQIAVKDTGAGIAPEDHKKVFQKFTQTESGLRQGGGTGLGMPITKSLVEAHNGQIWLESQVGVGTTFYFTLPLSISSPMILESEAQE